jgi:Fic family protein
MDWNWQFATWPHFTYDPALITEEERRFLLHVGGSSVLLKSITEHDRVQFVVNILSTEGLESSRIEGEFLERERLVSSLKKQFGLISDTDKKAPREAGMAEILSNVYETFNAPLTHEMLWQWHAMLFKNWSKLAECGQYRTHAEPMQIVSGSGRVYFEAPPSKDVYKEMTSFITWFNTSRTSGTILGRAAVAHVYFETIHPFEDGNGRIGRVLVEKALAQGVQRPLLIAVSKYIEKHKQNYYSELQKCNRTLLINDWVTFFARIITEAQRDAMILLNFIVQKSHMLRALSGHINQRQEKVLLRMFAEGPDGFKGGLSAEKYCIISKASRATATRDLADLVTKGALIKMGKLRNTRYWLNMDYE